MSKLLVYRNFACAVEQTSDLVRLGTNLEQTPVAAICGDKRGRGGFAALEVGAWQGVRNQEVGSV